MAGATPLGNMVIKLGLDDADFGKGVANTKKQVTYLAKEMQANMKIADMAGNKLGKLETRYDSLTQIIKAQENQVSSLKKAYDESFADGKATDSTKRLAAELQGANSKLANYQLQLQSTAGQMARLQVETQGVTGWMNKHADAYIKSGERIAQVGSNISKAGSVLTVGLTAPIVAGVTAVTKAAISWESAFAGVKKTNDEVTNSNGQVVYSYADLESGLRNLSKELPSSHTEIAAVAEAAGQLGIKTQDVVGFTKVMLDLGESTNLSAEDAASAIAKIANITGLTSAEYQKFGSSVVALGNNFATTESDIVEMANRLASAGTLAGLTNQEILGLATAMSSVGIEAEAGGTAMTQTLTALEKYVDAGGEGLEKLASIASMSSEQFATTWKEKPIEAIQAFIKGLGELDGKGESATAVLDELEMSGVRQSNMLKSLALASGTMTSAVDMSNKAWNENSALTKEANTRYETTESKLKMLKNEVVDTAIDLGGPFVDALRNGMQAARPVIEALGDLATKFNELDSEQQQNIIKWIGLAAATGPVLKLLGGGISVIGNTRKGIGLLSKGIVELKAASAEGKVMSTLFKSITGIGTASATSAGASGVGALTGAVGGTGASTGLIASLGAVAGPAAIAVSAVAAIGLATYAGVKAYEAHQLAGAKWGTSVTKEQDKVITKSYELSEKATSYVNEYADGVRGSADKAVKANNEIVESIEKTIKKDQERDEQAAKNLYSKEAQARAESYIAEQAKKDEATVASAKTAVDKINQILTNASNTNRNLSDEERQYIAENYSRLSDEQLKAAGFNKNQRVAIESAYQDDLSKLSDKQLQDRALNVDNALAKEQKSYEKNKKRLAEIYTEGTKEYKNELAELDKANKKNNESMILGLANLTLEQGFSLEQMSGAWEKYGWTTEEVAKLVKSSSSESSKDTENLGEILKMTGKKWSDLTFDPKTGKISVEGREELLQTIMDSGQWGMLKFEEKKLLVDGDEARITFLDTLSDGEKWEQYNILSKEIGVDNWKAIQAIIESEDGVNRWNQLDAETKEFLAKNDKLLKLVLNSEDALNRYNNISTEEKQLLVNNQDALIKVVESEEGLNRWNNLSTEEKEFLANNDKLLTTVLNSDETLQRYNNFPIEDKQFLANNIGLLNTIISSEENLNRWNGLTIETKQMLADNTNLASTIFSSENLYNSWNSMPDIVKNILGDNSSYIKNDEQAKQALLSWNGMSMETKQILGNNEVLLNTIFSSQESLNAWNLLPVNIKDMLANNQDILSKLKDGTLSVDTYNQTVQPLLKTLFGDNSDVLNKVGQAAGVVNTYNANVIPQSKYLESATNASETSGILTGLLDNWNKIPQTATKTLNVENKIIGPIQNAKGTNYHPGGAMIVNDENQTGPIKKELIIRPSGQMFIPQGRNVLLNEPVGTKVLRASRTKQFMAKMGIPRYAEGVGIPEESSFVKNLRSITDPGFISDLNFKIDNSNIESSLTTLIILTKKLLEKETDVYLDDDKISKKIEKSMTRRVMV
ncbi:MULTISPECIES: phage tail tape measure protein [unclassified Enterococcus]|uniref:phage tail tape measure protein n=1 Tax=unclassified Enterococcus TaxID=2608891 RepID=UPI0015547863|nr:MULTISPECIES: phage tail tape measure protein [unclassified Enterococcus]MBS7578290.1 phage tail tape measure protein [Enterococcus sp. MMGLQ5-2]MBS7585499.1 phage tail tape measure protein [Enterococcus sp. MMGLQ5-1]NPD13356.1 phage tail tape measure protein [Enterococcus sp. MMGLQ5-1]NPD38121.1 phage tail tape measure protein [Enterococcus sp. MMGLQ5-2]